VRGNKIPVEKRKFVIFIFSISGPGWPWERFEKSTFFRKIGKIHLTASTSQIRPKVIISKKTSFKKTGFFNFMTSGPIWPGAAAKSIFFHFRFHFCRLKRVLRAAQARYGKKWFYRKKFFFKNFFFQFYYFWPYLARGGHEINFPPDFIHYFNSI